MSTTHTSTTHTRAPHTHEHHTYEHHTHEHQMHATHTLNTHKQRKSHQLRGVQSTLQHHQETKSRFWTASLWATWRVRMSGLQLRQSASIYPSVCQLPRMHSHSHSLSLYDNGGRSNPDKSPARSRCRQSSRLRQFVTWL